MNIDLAQRYDTEKSRKFWFEKKNFQEYAKYFEIHKRTFFNLRGKVNNLAKF